MAPYLTFQVEPTGSGSGHVEVLGPIELSEGLWMKVESPAPGGWDHFGHGKVVGLTDDPAIPGSQKLRIEWDDVAFMSRWKIRLGANDGDVAQFSLNVSANISVVVAPVIG